MSSNKSNDCKDDRKDGRDDDRNDRYDDDRDEHHIQGLVVVGTNKSDSLTGSYGNDTISGGAGNDKIDGGKGDDVIDGGSGNDRVEAGAGNDTITGGAGNDKIDGGSGLDVAVYSGNFADYKLTLSRDGGHSGEDDDDHSAMTVHDLRAGAPDGVDVLKNVEILRFADGEYRDGHFYPVIIGNVAPVAPAQTITAIEGGATATANALATATDANGDALTVVNLPATLPAGVSYANGVFTFDPTNAAYDSLAQGVIAPVTVNYAVSDGTASTYTSVTFDVTGTNDAAVITGTSTASLTEADAIISASGQLTATDLDNSNAFNVLSNVVGTNGYGEFSIDSTGLWTYVTNTAHNEFKDGTDYTDSVTVNTADGTAKVITVTIHGSNDAPVAPTQTIAATEGGVIVNANALTGTSDAEGSAVSAVGLPSTYPTGVSYNATSHVFTFNPTGAAYNALHMGEHQLVTVNYSVSDGISSTPTSVTFDITGTNDKPMLTIDPLAGQDTTAPDAGTDVLGQFSTYDVDHFATQTYSVSGGVASTLLNGYDLASAGTYGTLYLNSTNGNYDFVYKTAVDGLLENGVGTQSFTVTVTDDFGATDSKIFTIDLTGTNDATVISGVKPFNYTVGDPAQVVAPELALNDPDGDYVALATVAISAGFSNANGDVLGFDVGTLPFGWSVTQAGSAPTDPWDITAPDGTVMTATFDSIGGKLNIATVSGVSTLADYAQLLDSVTFAATVAGAGPRTISFQVSDGSVNSNIVDTSNLSLLDLTTSVLRLPGVAQGDSSGFAVSAAGDVNGDGYADLIIGAPWVNDTATGTLGIGNGYVVYGKPSGMATSGAELPLASIDPVSGNGFTISGAGEWDNIGFAVRAAGDINGDGFSDVIIGSPYSDHNGSKAGLTYVVFGHASNASVTETSLDGTSGFQVLGGTAGDYAGYSVSGAGDLNGDGFADVIIGAPKVDLGNGTESGGAYVLFGHAVPFLFGDAGVPTLDLVTPLDGVNGFSIPGLAAGDWTGASVGSAGDVNGDGISDMIIGTATPTQDSPVDAIIGATTATLSGTAAAGVTVTIYENLLASNGDVSSTTALATVTADSSGAWSYTATNLPVVPYDFTASYVTPASASAYVVFGNDLTSGFGSSVDLSALDGTNGFRMIGAGTDVRVNGFGQSHYAVRSAGDVNGDGFGDVIVGAPYANTAHAGIAAQTGAAYVVFGQAGDFGTVDSVTGNSNGAVDLAHLLPSQGFTILGAEAGDRAGYAVSAAGDVNGDGYGDLIVGAPSAIQNGSLAGTSYVVFGKASSFGTIDQTGNAVVDLANLGNDGFRISAAAPRNDSGYSVSAAGDVNGDGFSDLLISSPNASPHIGAEGESYVIFGSKFITTPNTQVGQDTPSTLTSFNAGTTADDIFVAGQGDATMVGGGGKDSFSGGVGNDTIHLGATDSNDSSFLKIDGGGNHDVGIDTLVLDGTGMTLDLTAAGVASRIQNIECIDLGGHGNSITLDIHDVLNMSENGNALQIAGGSTDHVTVAGTATWTPGADQTIGLVTYHSYTSGLAQLLIDTDITPTFA